MSEPKRREVRILNPAGGCGWTTHKRAAKLIARGRARARHDVGPNVIEIIASVHRQGQHYVNLQVVISSTGTREFTTFGHYPMFPREFMRARFSPALHSIQ